MDANNCTKYKVLIVDDSAIARGIFEKAFKATQLFEVAGSVSNGRKAVDFCRSNEVDLVVTDYDMPEMNGVEATQIITKELGIPVCIYCEDNSAKADALGAGALLYEIKPSFFFVQFSEHGFIYRKDFGNHEKTCCQSLLFRKTCTSPDR